MTLKVVALCCSEGRWVPVCVAYYLSFTNFSTKLLSARGRMKLILFLLAARRWEKTLHYLWIIIIIIIYRVSLNRLIIFQGVIEGPQTNKKLYGRGGSK